MEPVYLIEEKHLTNLADALRNKTGETGTMTLSEIGDAIENYFPKDVPTNILDGSIKMYSNSEIAKVDNYAFANCTSLESIDLPACTYIGSGVFKDCHSLTSMKFSDDIGYIGSSAFANCSSLLSVNFSKVSSIMPYVFSGCTGLESIIFPICISISNYAFQDCSSLKFVNIPSCTNIYQSAFANCTALESINLPVCTSIGNSTFKGCTSLKSVHIPECTTIYGDAFANCTSLESINMPACALISGAFYGCLSLKSVSLPNCTTVTGGAFNRCSSLECLSLPKCSLISGYYTFQSCVSLMSLILAGSSVVKLSGGNTFSSTPMSLSTYTGSFGSIYVPASLVASYQSATNWAAYSSRITAIE